MHTVLTIAGSDCSGGAGIQADLKTLTVHDVYGMSAITALTAQNTTGVAGVLPVPPDFLRAQLDAVFADIWPEAVKAGMLASAELIEAAAERLRFYRAQNIVVDPVLAASTGHGLLEPEAIAVLERELLPLAVLVTPNRPEAERLAGRAIRTPEEMEAAAQALARRYGCAVLLKGGHSPGASNDLLARPDGSTLWYPGRRLQNPNTHGTGCTLSSAIAANLACGLALEQAIARAKAYLTAALGAGLNLGHGSGPLDHTLGGRALRPEWDVFPSG